MKLAGLSVGRSFYTISGFVRNTSYEPQLINAMVKGRPIEPLFLELKDAVILGERGYHTTIIGANPQVSVICHEGRNRASISEQLGIEYVPVRIFVPPLKNWFGGLQTYDAIWDKPRVETDILAQFGVRADKFDRVG